MWPPCRKVHCNGLCAVCDTIGWGDDGWGNKYIETETSEPLIDILDRRFAEMHKIYLRRYPDESIQQRTRGSDGEEVPE